MPRTLLITGGTGFLGRRLGSGLRRRWDVVLAGRNHSQNQAASDATGCPVLAMDVTNLNAVRDAVSEVRPSIIIHAAASKYVDTAERQPMECVDVNVVGSQNVARVAVDKDIDLVVGISTDKAAPPVANTYGLCKALMERVFCSMNGKTRTRFVCLRPGNIPWSTGSVLPIWTKMLEREGIITTTGPHMTRFLSTAADVVGLVSVALEQSERLQGTIVTREMKSVLIGHLLELFVARRGGRWQEGVARPGERQHEILIGNSELGRTRIEEFAGIKHYICTPSQLAPTPLEFPGSSETAEKFSDAELLEIIDRPPGDLR
jgi:UDP-N-acetylglucosamine 4,6-dehydratase/5-epimerase